MKKSDFFYDLPEQLIAQHPIEPRNMSRLMKINRNTGEIVDDHFTALPDILLPGDCLILNNSRVLPARIYGERTDSETMVEFLLLAQKEQGIWECLTGPGRRAKKGHHFVFGDGLLRAEVINILDGGNRLVQFEWNETENFYTILEQIGELPLPHYITERLEDKERYQTVYAKPVGSAAAPTAGLHFTTGLLESLEEKGVGIGFVTLHVGLGTFRPVKANDITNHTMHSEHYELPQSTADLINQTRARGGRVVAVGTTSCRTLESVASKEGCIKHSEGWTDIFIYPGYSFKAIDGLLTNFHLPESTLIMLVAAFAGYETTMRAYKQAVENEYRFFSFGDAMIIL